MKSIKRGRGPSMMGGFASIGMAVFGVIWTVLALNIGAPVLFAGFGLVFIALAIGSAVYEFKNATGKKRYSEWDIVDGSEEPDPLNERFGEQSEPQYTPEAEKRDYAYCPYCGKALDEGDRFCGSCGRKIR